MNLNLINQTKLELPEEFITKWVNDVCNELNELKDSQSIFLTIVFVSKDKAKELNSQFRDKDYATDILSFAPVEEDSLGELVLCDVVVRRQAKEHNLSLELEIGYLVLHGILHLLGYEHENGGPEAEKMFNIQDRIFEKLSKLY